jgi:lysophospholipase
LVLVPTIKNPVPLGAAAGYIVAHDGLRLRTAFWRPAGTSRKGTVCVFQGRAEFIEKYFETVSDLTRRGFAVATMDWRGQGGSDRILKNPRKGHVDDFADYERDLAQFMREVALPDCPPPYFALGHSMAGTVLLRAATDSDCWFERIVVTAPMLRIARLPLPPAPLARLLEVLSYAGFGDAGVPGGQHEIDRMGFAGNPLTSDPDRFARNREVLKAAPHLAIGKPTLGWVRASLLALADVAAPSFAAKLRAPVLMIAAGDDRIVSTDAIEALSVRMKTGSHLELTGARHEILQERDKFREQFWAAFDAFVPGETDRAPLERNTV